MKTAFLFPGQGAQHVGMGKDIYDKFPVAQELFGQASDVSGIDIAKMCFDGPEDELSRTDIAQPAIFTVSAAMLEVLKLQLGDKFQQIKPTFTAGLSLGEYTALYASGAMDFETAVKLVTRRGAAMQKAAEARESSMISILGLDEEKANELCQKVRGDEILTCANFNCPGQIVLSGDVGACGRAEQQAKDFGASGAIPLKVAGAFHSDFMAPAADELGDALQDVDFCSPETAVLANVDAQPYGCACEIKIKLLAQLTSSVRWQQCMEYLLAQEVEAYYEIGPGRVLAGLMRRTFRRANFTSVNAAEQIEKLVQDLA